MASSSLESRSCLPLSPPNPSPSSKVQRGAREPPSFCGLCSDRRPCPPLPTRLPPWAVPWGRCSCCPRARPLSGRSHTGRPGSHGIEPWRRREHPSSGWCCFLHFNSPRISWSFYSPHILQIVDQVVASCLLQLVNACVKEQVIRYILYLIILYANCRKWQHS